MAADSTIAGGHRPLVTPGHHDHATLGLHLLAMPGHHPAAVITLHHLGEGSTLGKIAKIVPQTRVCTLYYLH